MTPGCKVFAIQAAVDGQENLKINSGDRILFFFCTGLLKIEELSFTWTLTHIAMTNTSKFSFHKCIWERLAHTVQFKF